MKINLNTKSKTLKILKLRRSKIPALLIFNCHNYRKYKKKYLLKIKSFFKNSHVAIRSSFNNEDTALTSNAGKYKSFLNVNTQNLKDIEDKIEQVINSKKKINKNDDFFIQKMVKDIVFSGVILTRDLESYAKCLNINYHDGNNSEVVTSGQLGSKSIIYFKNKKYKIGNKFKKTYLAVNEIKNLVKEEDLDIEFAVDKNKRVYILQVRKLVLPNKSINNNSYQIIFNNLEKKIIKLKQKHHDLLGETTYFGNMPDWNPAEIIGTKPKPLALSLYQELITDHIWSQNRSDYSYRDLSQFHLMTTFYGTPYIDVRIDFNSWIPKSVNNNISKKIINYYLNCFNKKDSIHDKIEFEILFTCATFSTKKKLQENLNKILNKNEIETFYSSLKEINKKALIKKDSDYGLVKKLVNRQKIVQDSNLYELDKIYWLIEDCKKFGTLPFAGLARCGFIAIELLNSLEHKNIISNKEKMNFLSNVKTITSTMKIDLIKLKKNDFIKKYGHLRPGTYDITAKNYKENFQEYFNQRNTKVENSKKVVFKNPNIEKILKKFGIYQNKDQLFKFIKESIVYREYSKFIFSKSIDLIFENLKIFAKKYKIKSDDLAYLDINKILNMYFNLSNQKTIDNLLDHIKNNKNEYNSNKNINLPDVIKSPKDLFIQRKEFDRINYISNKKITSQIIKFNREVIKKNYEGIVCIENADPGFDFLFYKNIKGLVTKYGGLNSHMAIRCSELNIPALIGVGEQHFNNINNHKTLTIDCISKKIDLIN